MLLAGAVTTVSSVPAPDRTRPPLRSPTRRSRHVVPGRDRRRPASTSPTATARRPTTTRSWSRWAAGSALIDYDGDGLLDVFFTGGGSSTGPTEQRSRGIPASSTRTSAAGVSGRHGRSWVGHRRRPAWFYTHGAAVADYDRDGWPDLLVTGYGRVALFRNATDERHGRTRFREVTQEAGLLGDHFWATSAAWADLDGDGFPDLYVCQYVDWSFANHPECPGYSPDVERDVCPPNSSRPARTPCTATNADGTFREVRREAGLHAPRVRRRLRRARLPAREAP